MDKILEGLSQYGPSGLLVAAIVAFIWYRETRSLPALVTAFRAEIQEERALFERQLVAEREHCQDNHDKVIGKVNSLEQTVLLSLHVPRHNGSS